jgi:hypothetical protein
VCGGSHTGSRDRECIENRLRIRRAARAPYFYDGRAPSIRDLVRHDEAHFAIAFEGTEREDLIASLAAL